MHVCDWQIGVILVIIANGGQLPYAASFKKQKNNNVTMLIARFDLDSSAFRWRHRVESEAAVIPVICCS